MKIPLATLIFFLITNLGCMNNSKVEDLESKNKILELQNQILSLQLKHDSTRHNLSTTTKSIDSSVIPEKLMEANSFGNTKYVYVIVYFDVPKVKTTTAPASRTFTDDVLGYPSLLEETREVYYENYYSMSEIYTVKNYNEDKKYMKIEEFKEIVFANWRLYPLYNPYLGALERKITSIDAKVFDTYREASISKSKL